MQIWIFVPSHRLRAFWAGTKNMPITNCTETSPTNQIETYIRLHFEKEVLYVSMAQHMHHLIT